MKMIHTGQAGFETEFLRIKGRGKTSDSGIRRTVAHIVKDIAEAGDAALFRYTRKYDSVVLNGKTVEVNPEEMKSALSVLSGADLKLLKTSAARIEKYHRKQSIRPVLASPEKGIELGWLVRPLDRVGIYAPGGLAAYPSTVLMAAIPARVAGVREILLVSPTKGGAINPLVLGAAFVSGVKRVFKIGGAQAIAALAYGTESIPAVDKIVGPGNAFVTEAKRQVFGKVGIDMIAGPSEILIIAEEGADPACIASDLLSQAEHDTLASAVLLTPSEVLGKRVCSELKIQLRTLPRKSIAAKSISEYGAVILTRDLGEAVEIANRFAPEHLELAVRKPKDLLGSIQNAGAVFLGAYSPEAIGDYLAGPSHILPTAGTARFSSPLGVYDFIKRSSVISFSRNALNKYGPLAVRFAEIEGLQAHGLSVVARMTKKS